MEPRRNVPLCLRGASARPRRDARCLSARSCTQYDLRNAGEYAIWRRLGRGVPLGQRDRLGQGGPLAARYPAVAPRAAAPELRSEQLANQGTILLFISALFK